MGEGPERSALQALARSLDIAGSVHFVGYRSDARGILPACDVYVNSSTHEGISLTVLEAMAATLPVVATYVGGNPEVVVDGETGLLVPGRSPRHLAFAMARLLRDPKLRQTMGRGRPLACEAAFRDRPDGGPVSARVRTLRRTTTPRW